jgi:hypothetical protein
MHFNKPEILYFLFFLIIPILVHLFQLRRFKKEYFTNVKFLEELSVQTRKSAQIKKWLLLFTRLLLLTCLILAFAQPNFETNSKTDPKDLYIVIDNSFSMQAKGSKGELLKRAVEDLLEQTPETTTFSLLTNEDIFWNTDIKSIQSDLQNLKYSSAAFEIERLMATIQSHKSFLEKEVIIITDGQGIKKNQLKSIQEKWTTFFYIPTAQQKFNASVDSVYINQTNEKFHEIGVKISSFGSDSKEIPIALYNNKKLIAKTLIQLDTDKKVQKFSIEKGLFNGYVSITDNALEYDNDYYFCLSKQKKLKVLSIGNTIESEFLSRIYTQNDFDYLHFELTNLDYNSIEKQDAIVLNEIPEVPLALQTTLKSFVLKGGNLIYIPSANTDLQNATSFLNNFGKIKFNTIENTEKLITKIAFNHPLYGSVFEKKIDNFQYPNTKISFNTTTSTPPALSFADQSVFLTALVQPLSNVYVFTAPLNKASSNFKNSPLIVPTFYNMAQNTQKTGVTALTINTGASFVIDAHLNKGEIISLKNDATNEKFIPQQELKSNKIKLIFNDAPKKAGNFGVYKQSEFIETIGFNYNRTEGNLLQNNSELFADYKVVDSIESLFDTIKTSNQDAQLWKWFLCLSLLFIIAEIVIQKYVK